MLAATSATVTAVVELALAAVRKGNGWHGRHSDAESRALYRNSGEPAASLRVSGGLLDQSLAAGRVRHSAMAPCGPLYSLRIAPGLQPTNPPPGLMISSMPETDDHRLVSRRVAAIRNMVHRYQRIGFGVVGRDAAERDAVRNHDKVLHAALSSAEMAGDRDPTAAVNPARRMSSSFMNTTRLLPAMPR